MQANRLWAKSWNSKLLAEAPRSAYLREHLRDAYAATDRVIAATGVDQLGALDLPPEQYLDRFRRITLLAAAVHDLGKANDHFQAMIRGCRDVRNHPQGLRHEWATILILQRLKPWLLPAVDGNEADWAIMEWAVVGHHPALNHPSPPKCAAPGAGVNLTLLLAHSDFRETLEWLRETFDLKSEWPDAAEVNVPLVGVENAFQQLCQWQRTALQRWDRVTASSSERRFVAAVKNCLIAGDVAGSAIPRVVVDGPELWSWIDCAFDSRPRPGDLESIVKHRLNNDLPRPFQEQVQSSTSPVTFVKAGCGTGKTLAAYMWAAQNHPNRRLYFCYPTTGTATEGFKDYLYAPEGDLKEINADLFHSRRDVDFEIILTTGPDAEREEVDAVIRVESLDAWSTPIVACTVDTVLGLVQNNKRGLFGWPALAQSAFVFDEIHAFDDKLFGALLRFLRDVPGVPVLLMTASLPKPREEALRKTLAKRNLPLTAIPGPSDLETLPRYHRVDAPNDDPLPLVQRELESGGKVLWVCNTVNRVMEAADRAAAAGLQPLIYHSRFRYVDRVERHKAVIDAFSPDHTDSVLAVTSQVCEMSLDLKGCTLLVTEYAPVPALIQRLGRLNRQARGSDPTRPFVVTAPEHPAPYDEAELAEAIAWLDRLPAGELSQHDLAANWEPSSEDDPVPVDSAWVDGGPVTEVKELRNSSPGISIILDCDREAVLSRPKLAGRYIVPMPQPSRDWQTWDRVRGIPVAPEAAVDYDPMRGASWRK
ncbi:MAG: CRISPR-associated helicase Cas3' [Planctomycetaceae bacterium]